MACGKLEAGLRRNCQRGQAGCPQIVVQRADRRCADHVAGPGHRKRRNRQAAGERLQQHQAEGIGLARKHEDVGGRIGLRQFFALPRAEKHRLRIFSLQRRARRPVADDHLGAGQIEIEKSLEILFHRDAADAQKDRTRQAEIDWRADETWLVSTPRGHNTTLRKPRARNSLASAGVAAITAWLGPWNPRSAAQIQDSGIGKRAEMYSGKRVWKLVVNGKPCLRQ